MKKSLLYFLVLFAVGLTAQKKTQKMVLADAISLLQIDATNCFIVEVNTYTGNEVSVEAQMEGEYSQDLDLKLVANGGTLLVETGFTPTFENPNDKLSAHKVVSIVLKLTMPSYKNLEIYGTNSRVVLDGVYKEVSVSLSDGASVLDNVLANSVTVKSQSGNINVSSKAAVIKASSKYGHVSANPIPYGESIYELQTVTGNIDLFKTE